MQKARADLESVYALGRMFGYLQTMEAEQPRLALSREQAERLKGVADRISGVRRFDPKTADAMLTEIEDKILTPQQLQSADQLALKSAGTRGGTNQRGNTEGSGPLAAYASGGPFNPMTDASTTMGKNFVAFYQMLTKKIGR